MDKEIIKDSEGERELARERERNGEKYQFSY